MEIRQICYVLEVAKYRNFSKAAKALYITQPTISQQISALETELQTKLFERSTHSVKLTKDGEKFCRYARKVTDAIDDLMTAFDQETASSKAVIKVGVFPFYRTMGLSKCISNFFSANANIIGGMEVVDNYEAYDQMSEGGLNFAIIKSRVNFLRSEFHYDTLRTEKLYAVISADNPHASDENFPLQLFGEIPLLTGAPDSHYYNEMKELLESAGVQIHVAFTNTKDTTMIREMVADDMGVNIVSEAVAKAMDGDEIRALPIVPDQEILTLLVYPADKKLTGAEIAFRKHIIRTFTDTRGEEEM